MFYASLILGAIVTVAVLSFLKKWLQRRRTHACPRRLFLNLCGEHKLKWSESWLLWRLAKFLRLTDPGRLFLEPQWFEASRIPASLRPQSQQLKSLRIRLFAEPAKSTSTGNSEKTPASGSKHQQSTKGSWPASNTPSELDVSNWQTMPPSQHSSS